MKFQHLKVGQKFEYQGYIYVKSSPLLASHAETGEQKLIPRYAAIVVTEISTAPADKKPAKSLNAQQVQVAFNTFYDSYLDSLQKLKPEIEVQALESFQSNLENARQLLLSELGLQD